MNQTGVSTLSGRRYSQLALLLGGAALLLGAVLPLVPEQYRPANFAPFGAAGLFLAARGGRGAWMWGIGLVAASKLTADLLNYLVVHSGDAAYLPAWPVYVALAAYPLLGWLLLRATQSYFKTLATTALAGVPFFIITNALAWYQQALPYPLDFGGLMQAYLMGLPFHWTTLASDLAFTGILFAALAELTAVRPAPAVLVPVEVRA